MILFMTPITYTTHDHINFVSLKQTTKLFSIRSDLLAKQTLEGTVLMMELENNIYDYSDCDWIRNCPHLTIGPTDA